MHVWMCVDHSAYAMYTSMKQNHVYRHDTSKSCVSKCPNLSTCYITDAVDIALSLHKLEIRQVEHLQRYLSSKSRSIQNCSLHPISIKSWSLPQRKQPKTLGRWNLHKATNGLRHALHAWKALGQKHLQLENEGLLVVKVPSNFRSPLSHIVRTCTPFVSFAQRWMDQKGKWIQAIVAGLGGKVDGSAVDNLPLVFGWGKWFSKKKRISESTNSSKVRRSAFISKPKPFFLGGGCFQAMIILYIYVDRKYTRA